MKEAHKHLIQWGLDRGYKIEVDCLDGYVEYEGSDYDKAVEAVEASDCGGIYFVDGLIPESIYKEKKYLKGENNYVAGFGYDLEHDQEPDEIITDWGINEISEAWDKDYTIHCDQYQSEGGDV